MKTDMSGAADRHGASRRVASRLGLRVRIDTIALLTENLVGDKATKPGDVLTIRNGMTIEVLNTDAEGRLVLADGLSLAAETDADAIIDVATLTGAQNVALGDEVGALFSSDDDLAAALVEASERSGEPLWRMPLVDSYESHIESDVADMKNIGKPPQAGSIVAALLLRRFTDGRAVGAPRYRGPARAEAPRGYLNRARPRSRPHPRRVPPGALGAEQAQGSTRRTRAAREGPGARASVTGRRSRRFGR